MTEKIGEILHFWFGQLDSRGLSTPRKQGLWFKSSPATDGEISQLFGVQVAEAVKGNLGGWADSNEGLIALILLLDQFTRNTYRGTPGAFSGDSQAVVLAKEAIANSRHRNMPLIHRVFLYLPLEHSEELAVQEHSVTLFQEMSDATDLKQMHSFTRYAVAHRDVIARFGRFPHRNSVLGRSSTTAETAYIATHGGF